MGEKVVKRMMVHVADAVEKVGHVSNKSVMFPTRDTAVVTASSNCCGHFICEGTFGVLWDRKDPNCTSVCKVSILVCLPLFHVGVPHNIASSAAPERKLPRRRRRTFHINVTNTFLDLQMRWVTVTTSNGCQLERAGPLWLQEQWQQRMYMSRSRSSMHPLCVCVIYGWCIHK